MKTRCGFLWAVSLAVCGNLAAATLCVNPGGTSGCYARINDAIAKAGVSDTIHVSAGTYKEAVLITKPVVLTGDDGAVIDATGLGVGMFVNGIGQTSLRNVTISGFTVENANFEGILLANVGAVTVSSNKVMNNNKALTSGTCPGLPSFETNEQSDCGEGIHLLAVNHSIIVNNVVQGNSGGILLADDTGGTYSNLISENTVQDNPWACGITLASHPPAAITKRTKPLGVFHNTVYNNHSARNGLSNGGGAGIGIFDSVPFASNYGNVIVGNYVDQNGLPGIAMHAHVPGQNLSDNMIIGNTILDNGADTEDAATPGPTGINVFGAGAVTGTMVFGNFITDESVGVAVNTNAEVQVNWNNLVGPETGVTNLSTGSVNANANWWGCSGAPGTSGCSTVSGPNVDWRAWLTSPVVPPSY